MPQVIANLRNADPNALYEKFLKMGTTEFMRGADPLEADEWIVYTKNVFDVFQCLGR